MKYHVLWTVVATGLLTGCQNPQSHYRAQLADVHDALTSEETGQAARTLADADAFALEHDLPATVGRDLLDAELKLQDGQVLEALSVAQAVAERCGRHSVARGAAEELIGKCALRQGQYDAAVEHFVMADSLYGDADDKQRVGDLMKLAQGLSFYALGNLDDARAAWTTIHDSRLRDALDQELQALKLDAVSSNY